MTTFANPTLSEGVESWRSVDWTSPSTDLPPQAPEHPIPTMQGAFEESMRETIDAEPDGADVLLHADSLGRRRHLLESPSYERTVAGRWKQKSGENFHPLWKLVAQISFGMHLLHRGLAKSDDEVIRILQTHVDEIDGFLERTTEDLDLAQRDINERVRYLKLPLEHGDVFDTMLGDRKFRTAILEGNEKIEHIVDRTSVALRDTLKDVKKGFDGTRELARYFKRLDKTWDRQNEEHSAVYAAMMGNTEGWTGAYLELQQKGNTLHESLVHLGGIIAEIQRRVGVASRKDIPSTVTSRNNTRPNSRGADGPLSPGFPTQSSGSSTTGYQSQRSISDSRSSQDNKSAFTGDRYRQFGGSTDSLLQDRKRSSGSIKNHGRRVSFSDKAKGIGGKLSLSTSRSSHKNMSPKDRKYEKSMPKTARESIGNTPWDERRVNSQNGSPLSVKESVKSDKGKRRSMSSGGPKTPYDIDAILNQPPRQSEISMFSSTPSSAGTMVPPSALSLHGPPLRMSESVNSPPFHRRGTEPFPDQVITEEDEPDERLEVDSHWGQNQRDERQLSIVSDQPAYPESQADTKDGSGSEEDDFEAEIVDAEVTQTRAREVSISGRTSPSGQFKPQVMNVSQREAARSIDSLPSQARNPHGFTNTPSNKDALKRSSSTFSGPTSSVLNGAASSLQSTIAMLRRSSTFQGTGTSPSAWSHASTNSRPTSDLRPAPLNIPQSATAAYFRRPSSPTSVYTDNHDNSTSGSKTPPAGGYAQYRLGSVSSSAPRSAPPGRTSFLRSNSSTTNNSTPTDLLSPRSPPAHIRQASQQLTSPPVSASLQQPSSASTQGTSPMSALNSLPIQTMPEQQHQQDEQPRSPVEQEETRSYPQSPVRQQEPVYPPQSPVRRETAYQQDAIVRQETEYQPQSPVRQETTYITQSPVRQEIIHNPQSPPVRRQSIQSSSSIQQTPHAPIHPSFPRPASPPAVQSPNTSAPERVPSPPRFHRMNSQSAPERLPTPKASPDLRALTSATVSGPEPDFPFGWNEEDDEVEAEELDASPYSQVQKDAPVELSARPRTSDGPKNAPHGSELDGQSSNVNSRLDSKRGSGNTEDEEGGSNSRGSQDTERGEEFEDNVKRGRDNEALLRKQIEEQRRKDIAKAKKELEELTRQADAKKAQADILSRVANQTGGKAGTTAIASGSAADSDALREQRFPTGDTKLLHKPPPVIVDNASISGSRRGSVEDNPNRNQSAAGADNTGLATTQFIYPNHSPLGPTTSNLSPPEPDHDHGNGASGSKSTGSRSPWRKVFGFGSGSNHTSASDNGPRRRSREDKKSGSNKNSPRDGSNSRLSPDNAVHIHPSLQQDQDETRNGGKKKKEKGLGISLGAFGRHRKSRSLKEARLAQAAERSGSSSHGGKGSIGGNGDIGPTTGFAHTGAYPDVQGGEDIGGGGKLSDGRMIRHGGWGSGNVGNSVGVNGVNGNGKQPPNGFMPTRDEGTVPIPGVGTMDFGRASMLARGQQDEGEREDGEGVGDEEWERRQAAQAAQGMVVGGTNTDVGDVPAVAVGNRF